MTYAIARGVAIAFLAGGAASWATTTPGPVSLRVVAGSALDLSGLDAPGNQSHQRYLCASQPFGVDRGFPNHAEADEYAEQLKMHGYNLARFHFVENLLMQGARSDFDFNAEQVDRFHYFLQALKKRGIGWTFDALTSWNGAKGDVGPNRWRHAHNLKLELYHDEAAFAHWQRLVESIYGARSKYSGQRLIDDASLFAIVLVNEGGLNPLINEQASPELDAQFRRWLVGRYGAGAKATAHWGREAEPIERVQLPRKQWSASARMADAQRFYAERQAQLYARQETHLRTLGYKGRLTAYDNWFTLQDIAARRQLPLVAAHSYHDHPTDFTQRGSTIQQSSSIQGGLAYVRDAATSRYWGKPFALTEYDQPFWNKWRFESGLAMGAYAAFQQWDVLCRHTNGPIEFSTADAGKWRQIIQPFGGGIDPVTRASETLAALLYRRGDVQPAKERVAVVLDDDYVYGRKGGIERFPPGLTAQALTQGIGVVWDGDPLPAGVSRTIKASSWQEGVAVAPARYTSDTGEIQLDTRENWMKVITPRTEAVAFAAAPQPLGKLTVQESSAPALVAVSALDGRALDKSGRMLVIVAGDARNSAMQFIDPAERVLGNVGLPPIQLQAVTATLRLKRPSVPVLKAWRLARNGARLKEVPVTRTEQGWQFTVHTVEGAEPPTTYFELAER